MDVSRIPSHLHLFDVGRGKRGMVRRVGVMWRRKAVVGEAEFAEKFDSETKDRLFAKRCVYDQLKRT